MKRILVTTAIIYLSINLILALLFFFGGGAVMLSRPVLPEVPSQTTLETDLAYFRQVVLDNEVSVSSEQRAAFLHILDSSDIPESLDGLTLLATRALATLDNAHTTVLSPMMRRLPLRFHWTADALVIVKTRPDYSHLLGRRVLLLGGETPESLLDRMNTLVGGGTANWRRYRSEYFFSAPTALAFLGAQVDDLSVTIRTRTLDGFEADHRLAADIDPMPGNPFWDFRDSFPDDDHLETQGWQTLLSGEDALPHYLQDIEDLHSVRILPGLQSLYLRMNASFADDTENLKIFKRRALDLIDQNDSRNIIVDFRHNRGGDYTQVLPLVRSLSRALPPEGRLYLIVGPNTFSAGIVAASQFKRFLPDRLTVVGSEIGDLLRFKAEGLYPRLPSSGLQLYLTKAWTDLADGCGFFGDCWFPNKFLLRAVGSLDIDISVENTWESYSSGRDLVMEAVAADLRKHAENDHGISMVS